jgi:hypothetical protein
MDRAPVFRNLDRRQEWLGLEPGDLFVLASVGWLLMMLAPRAFAWNALIVIGCAIALRIAKRGKPPGYLLALARFYLVRRRPFHSAAAPDLDARAATGDYDLFGRRGLP